jgi:hypothetical protein
MQIRKLEEDIARTLTALASTGALLKGSISKVTLGEKTRNRGKRIAYLLTYKGAGSTTKSLYIPKDQVPEVKRMIRNYQQLKGALGKLLDLNVNLFKARQLAAKRDARQAARQNVRRLVPYPSGTLIKNKLFKRPSP